MELGSQRLIYGLLLSEQIPISRYAGSQLSTKRKTCHAQGENGHVRLNCLERDLPTDYPAGMAKRDPFKYFKSSPEITRLAVMLYVRFPLFASEIRRKRAQQLRAFLNGSGTWVWCS